VRCLSRADYVLNGTFLLNLGHAQWRGFLFVIGWKIGDFSPIDLRNAGAQ
jgi:hypothetical protein